MIVSRSTRVRYVNEAGVSIELAPFSQYFLLLCDETVPNVINAEKLSFLHGEQFVSASLGAKDIYIHGYIIDPDWRRMKRTIEQAFNATISGTLYYANSGAEYRIDCMLDKAPEFTFTGKRLEFTVSLRCLFPFWRGRAVTEWVSTIVKMGHFPLVIPPEGFVFGYRADTLQSTFENRGDAATEIVVTVCADGGSVKNPSIKHVETGDEVKVFYTLNDGEYITFISRHDYNDVLINGVTSGMKYLTDETKQEFFLLEFGMNTIAYNADANASNMAVSVDYEPLYLGVP